jgi:hypothetical protein
MRFLFLENLWQATRLVEETEAHVVVLLGLCKKFVSILDSVFEKMRMFLPSFSSSLAAGASSPPAGAEPAAGAAAA